nr:unnamed protein product [Digitaria exilis]
MIVDFVNLSSDDDDDVVVAREEHSVHGKGRLIHAKAEFVDLTIDGDIVEGEHLSYGQGKAAQGTTFLKQKFIADDEQAEVVQCRATLRMEELTAGNAQAEAAQCTATLRMEEHIEGDGQGDAAWSTGRLQMQELRADHGQSDAVQCATTLQMQELRTDDVRGDAAHCATTVQRQEISAEMGQNDAAQCTATLQMQELIADDVQSDASQFTTTLQRHELTVDVGHGDAAQCTETPMQELVGDDRQGDAAQCTETLMQELGEDDGQGDVAQRAMTLQRQELTLDDGQGDAAQFTPTLERQEFTEDNEQGDAVSCTSTSLQRQQLNPDDGQDAVALCTTTLPRQKSISDGAQGDVPRFTIAVQRQESDTDHAKGNTARCTTSQRQKFLAADDSMQETVHFRSSAESTTCLLRTQEGSHRVTGSLDTYNAATAEQFPRQFWKAGDYGLASQAAINRMFSTFLFNPTSVFVLEQMDKTTYGFIPNFFILMLLRISGHLVVNNGATFVKIDKMKLSCDGDYALVIEDNGGGMSPESLRHCMSFGFSQKCTAASIGRYGNGFKTSTMRLGADAIVFTCTKDNRRLTRSVGLLSYTFLMTTKCNDIFVPTVDYEFDALSSTFQRIINCGEKHFSSNLSTLLRWCPFCTEGELLNQDIMISGAPETRAGRTVEKLTQMHVANRFRYSLRVYASMLYLHLPESFQIILCGQAVEPHYAVNDLIYRECIKYQPQVEVTTEVDVITTIGYLRGAPLLDIYGFNVYHKNRLILVCF